MEINTYSEYLDACKQEAALNAAISNYEDAHTPDVRPKDYLVNFLVGLALFGGVFSLVIILSAVIEYVGGRFNLDEAIQIATIGYPIAFGVAIIMTPLVTPSAVHEKTVKRLKKPLEKHMKLTNR